MPPETARADILRRLFTEAPARSEWFAPGFLAQVPADAVATILAGLKRQFGELRDIAPARQGFVVRLARADVPAQISLDAEDHIAGLLFQDAVPTGGALEGYVEALAGLPGRTAVLVTTDGVVRAAHNADTPLAVGSAFKLAILHATALACDAGRLRWDQVVALDPAWRSLPTGILQDWPAGTPVTVGTLAALMISISDNTAADALLRMAGREAVEAVSPRNAPFLSTREAFILKGRTAGKLRRRWAEADAGRRREVLRTIIGLPLPDADLAQQPTLEVEWVFTAHELCALLDATAHLPALGINPGPAAGGGWKSVAYKGGSETGVLNTSVLAVSPSGKRHCIVATWNNDAAIEDGRLLAPFGGLLGTLANEG